ncbi:lipocalin-like domain-containing protein [Changchengzhania lutea]|uniref:lipocalin-like domain-containing protein n=1 Tax=Changchengzhania lutea TaxID=2049305 RepID=UPI00115F33B6|nr:lipocalin-like domain-containing protein [Changchengzhania lutea]
MNYKTTLSILVTLLSLFAYSQDWKVYPYTPSTTPASEIAFPVDEGRHTADPVEWWYTSGSFTGDTSGNVYSFMLTYFYYPQSGFDGFRILNVTDEATGEFFQDTQPVNYTLLSETNVNIQTESSFFLPVVESWKNKMNAGNPIAFEYELFASSSAITLDVELVTTKRPLIVGGDGFFDQGLDNYTYYYSQTGNALTGDFTLNGTTETVSGNAWIDRQYGDFNPFTGEDYEWFSIQLSNGTDLNFWNVFNAARQIPNNSNYVMLSAYVDENESTQYVTSDFEIERLEYFTTTDDAKSYSKKWRLTSASKNLDLVITANHTTTEVDISLIAFRFFEGSVSVSGTDNGVAVTGVGFAELLHDYFDPDVSMSSPSGGTYNPTSPITWTLNNPDEGRPVTYDLEYSIDNQATFTPIATGLTVTSYTWDGSGLTTGDDVWFKVKAYSVDNTLNSEVISTSASSATFSSQDLSKNLLRFYPNPVQDNMYITFSEVINSGTYDIINLNGKSIFSQDFASTKNLEINTSSFASGLYFLSVRSNNTQELIKFIKQ